MGWLDDWDESAGLWLQKSPGHTVSVASCAQVHPGPNAAARLLLAAEVGQLGQLNSPAVLRALRKMQVTDGSSFHGCMLWYLEEPCPRDTNAAFFTALSLLVLQMRFRQQLPADAQATLGEILADLRVWFDHTLAWPEPWYLNKFMGDLVCAHLLGEAVGAAPHERLVQVMHDSAAYWRANGYGWAEHMSDCYSQVAMSQVSLLLTLSQSLSAPLREQYQRILEDLVAIEEAFGGQPRVPAIRSYAFGTSPTHTSFRSRVRPRAGLPETVGNMPDLCPLLHELGWHRLVPPPAAVARDIRVPCFGGAAAVARIEPDVRLGTMSRYPLMSSADHANWGLSWQSFPAAMWRNEGDWMYLQWHAQEDGPERCHPALRLAAAYMHNALTTAVRPPIVGRTFSIQRGGRALVLRVLPAVAASWRKAGDRLCLVDCHAQLEAPPTSDHWSVLHLRYPQRTVCVNHVDLWGSGSPVLRREGGLDWQVALEGSPLDGTRMIVGLWGIDLDGPMAAAPQARPAAIPAAPRSPNESAWDIRWPWAGETWHVRADPLAAEPLTEIK